MNEQVYTIHEVVRQDYLNCHFAAGHVEGHPVDTVYLEWERGGDGEPSRLLLRPDEAAAIAWVLNGALWRLFLEAVEE